MYSPAYLFLRRACKGVFSFALPVSLQEVIGPLLWFSPPREPVCPAGPQGSLAPLHSLQAAGIHMMVQVGNCCAPGFCSCCLHLCNMEEHGWTMT